MSSEKMGQFILELRKSQQMTQKELAQKLNVTDKAVSKWERGLCYPDISLLSPLACTLGVTAGELLNGERSPESNTETDIAINNVLQYADNAVKTNTKSARKRTILAAAGAMMMLMGLTLLFYPSIIRRWNASRQAMFIVQYYDAVVSASQYEINEHFRRAEEHNATLSNLPREGMLKVGVVFDLPEDYHSILNIDGIMGRVEIPRLNINLPIFHGTTQDTLDRGAGHLEGTAFPIGGYDNHSVIVAHSGLSHAVMFRDLSNINEGDFFFISVLGQRMVYQVDSIITVLPHEVDDLRVIPGADIVTLITCTPYRINTHRLLVRGTRVEYIPYEIAS